MRGGMRITALLLAVLMVLSCLGGCKQALPGEISGQAEGFYLADGAVQQLSDTSSLAANQSELPAGEIRPLAEFSMDLMHGAVTADRKENMVLSPVSAYLALLVTACGSEGECRKEFEQVLGVPDVEWGDWGRQLMSYMNWTSGDSQVTAANSVWIDEGASVHNDYLKLVSEKMYTDVFQGDLSGQKTMKVINAWANKKTQGMIPELLQSPYNEIVKVAILNAVYFEAKWKEPFHEEQTEEKVFYTAENKEVTTEFLQDRLCRRAYVKGEGMDGLLLPYNAGNIAFMALRPAEGQSVDQLLLSLTPESWDQLIDTAADTLMNVSMPKFTLEYRQELTDVVEAMGLKTMTGGMAQLTSMGADGEGNPLTVSGIGQTVKIQVDEEGTKAAAVTAVTAAGAIGLEDPPMELHFDHPYVYAIVDTNTGLPLFVGVMDQPVIE